MNFHIPAVDGAVDSRIVQGNNEVELTAEVRAELKEML